MKKRERRTNLEALGGGSGEVLKVLRTTAREAELPLERVFRDCLAIGISVIGNPETSPYTSLITFRHELATHSKRDADRAPESGGPSQLPGFDDLAETVHDASLADAGEGERTDAEGPGDALERSGLQSTDGTLNEVLSVG
jgi:hypothetical protein